jgi:rfaE bifunctional protein nucleotidyltransferase chain/domain
MIKVFTAGTWDLFHVGHLNILRKSKALGDYLVVGVSTEELVLSYKNKKPIISLEDRIEIIKSCRYVDEVIIQEELLGLNMLEKIKPDIFTIGSDWKNKTLEGMKYMKNNGIKIHYFDYTNSISSTSIIEKIKGK